MACSAAHRTGTAPHENEKKTADEVKCSEKPGTCEKTKDTSAHVFTPYKCKKTKFIKAVIGDIVAHLKPKKITISSDL